MNNNIILIGMPGCGKSTLGVLLAKALGYSFIDTDLIISRKAGTTLQNILNSRGLDSFLSLEEEVGKTLECEYTVVATGGSMVLSDAAMAHLKKLGKVVYIKVGPDEIKSRVTNITTRGIAFHPHETLDDVYLDRTPRYERYSDLTIEVTPGQGSIEDTVRALADSVNNHDTL